ncbi:hypothetical protein LTR36_006217 [Oleoguttula mirabilis]|uniref:HMG box domain-containing protein n=1 Tax=Oleoguttula mirabilis TaxID=1507867 RepID=A0AAV9JC30_9PEZI|nr:hypothetical protein LTR36_006217 [Oleoguttula mirabilis]
MSGINTYSGEPNTFSDDSLNNFYSGSDFTNFGGGNDMDLGFGIDSNTGATPSPVDLSSHTDFDQFFPSPAVPQEVQPMHIPLPAPQPALPQGPPGAHFHPSIGWFYPAAAPVAFAPAGFPSNQGYAPMAPPPQMLQAPEPQPVSMNDYYGATPQKLKTNVRPQGNKRKQYFGPAAHFGLDVQSQRLKREATDDSDDEPPRKMTRTVPKLTRTAVPSARKRSKPPSIEIACVCATGSKAATGVKRPKNSFIIFRMMHQKQIQRELNADPATVKTAKGHVRHDVVSRAAGARWKALSDSQKQPYQAMQEAEAQKHRELYPDYKYDPKARLLDVNFGTPECRCGAYQANMAKARRLRGSEDFSDDDSEPEELDDYVPPRSTPAYKAPVAQMNAPAQPLPDVMPDYGFTTPAQQAEAAKQFAAMKARQNAAPVIASSRPAPTRRSSRNHANVSYIEPSETIDVDEDDDFEANMTAQLSEALSAPSPQLEGTTKRRPSQISTPYNSPPAHNTRARSRASLDLPTIPEGADLTGFEDLFGDNGEFNMDDFLTFGEDADAAMADADDTIVVADPATRRNSSRNPSKLSPNARLSPRHKAASPQGVEKRRNASPQTTTRTTRRSPRRS